MLFNTPEFIVFLCVVLALYYSLTLRFQNWMLLIASYFFYGWWDWRFLVLLATSSLVDFRCGLKIGETDSEKERKAWLLVSLVVNFGILGFFKYFNFFTESFVAMLSMAGLPVSTPALKIILPVGISFYTFQSVAYTIDIYRGKEIPTRDALSFFLYVSFFPQLVAGPIERSTHLLPQLKKPRRVSPSDIDAGLQLLLLGYFKKLVIADSVAPYVDSAFRAPVSFSGIGLLFSLYLFALQIYCDFSGYTDIARGVAKLLGIDLQINFRQPYLSTNITDFWRRWHISLSSWLRDYLYIPLGGSRGSRLGTYRNIMITMLLGGLWHGAAWNFVIWGGLHGAFLIAHREWRRRFYSKPREIPSAEGGRIPWIQVGLTFHLVCFAWIFFRAESPMLAFAYLQHMVTDWHMSAPVLLVYVVGYMGIVFLVDLSCRRSDSQNPLAPIRQTWVRGALYCLGILSITLIGEPNAAPFIYFQF